MPKTIKELHDFAIENNKNINSDDLDFLIAERLNLNPSQYQLNQDRILSDEELQQLSKDLKKLAKGVSAQYILGYSWFYGHKIMVQRGVLIPRFETEELVAWTLEHLNKNDSVLDLGTGSGCILVALTKEAEKKDIRGLHLTASDISDSALRIAEENFLTYDVDALVRKANVLLGLSKFDKIISNPPYIKKSETDIMDKSVLQNEPENALFGGEDGLNFYRKFAKQVRDHLNSRGEFFMEFGFRQKDQLAELFAQELSDFDIEFKKDLAGKDRMVHGRWQK